MDKIIRHPSIECRADEAMASRYDMADGTVVVAYCREDAEDFFREWKAGRARQPHPEEEAMLL